MDSVAYVGAPLDSGLPWVVEIEVLKVIYKDLSDIKRIRDVLVLTSKRGVISLKMASIKIDSKRIYCIGYRTADFVKKLYSRECVVPDLQNTDGLASILIGREEDVRVVCSDSVSPEFLDKLKEGGVNANVTIAYKVKENGNTDFSGLEKVDKILVGSPRSFEILHRRARDLLRGKEVWAIGLPTYRSMLRKGIGPAGYFETPNIEEALTNLRTEG